jgi:hypothetical protein
LLVVSDLADLIRRLPRCRRREHDLEIVVRAECDAVLLAESPRERVGRERARRDEDLAQQPPPTTPRLLGERLVQLDLRQESVLDEHLAQGPPRGRLRLGGRGPVCRRLVVDGLEPHAMLLAERRGQRERGDDARFDQDLAQ